MMWMDELSLHVKKNIFNWISVWYFVETIETALLNLLGSISYVIVKL